MSRSDSVNSSDEQIAAKRQERTENGTEMTSAASKPRYRAAVDTPLGVTFHDFYALGSKVIVTETVEKKIAEVMGFKPSEVELVTVTDNKTGALLWPKG